ncbi:MAG: 30S ribosomal protein S12 methylthiotransferase RimO [Rikenellaceae bacterium]
MDKINVITLGCSKNVVDSEHLMAQFADAGYELIFDSNSTDAKIVVINTCGFIGDAKEESIETILSFTGAKERGEIEKLYVIGCLSERYKDELKNEIPEVDEFFGVRNIFEVLAALKLEYKDELRCQRVLTTPRHYAYLKISEGCNWGCGYCAIPLIRGKHVSVPIEDLITEAKMLVEGGAKEIIVIAQDTTYYGMDLYGERRLSELLTRLCELEGLEWLRLHYAYPTAFPDDVIETMAREKKICKYLDIPFQHISDAQLKSMRRGINKEKTYALVNKLRTAMPDMALRTTMLVGYPGESEGDFNELMDFVSEVKFERLGVFAYSPEEDTYSATELSDDVSDVLKQERVERIMSLQNEISYQNNLKRVGEQMRVVVDRLDGEYYVARSEYDSPDVDQEILIASATKLEIGAFYLVKITDAEQYDLYGELIN